MKLDRLLFPIETLGPGKRLVIWTKGCSKHCEKCANPELWEAKGAKEIPAGEIAGIILNIHKETPVDGITISGGDPLEQAEELFALLKIVKPFIDDILVYTGFYHWQLQEQWSAEWLEKLEENISVLIDGPYVDGQNDNTCPLRGSANQSLIFFDEKYRKVYQTYLNRGRKIQNVYMGNRLISVGIHNRNEGECDEKA